ncbi:MAG: cytochrome C [Betaproteobacteria bacterium]|nr:MAG: cytochrome C [Betaproteobacteria bacterium]
MTIRLAAVTSAIAMATGAAAADSAADMIERGRYVVKIGGCNDCHTPDYAAKGGRVPEKAWLTGDALGWRGPWGTTYPTNLRLYLAGMSEEQWVKTARTLTARPPMPWFNVRDMSEQDLRALYRFVSSLGPAGHPAPAYLPPDRQPAGPVVAFPTLP